jgi:hypothetical protein
MANLLAGWDPLQPMSRLALSVIAGTLESLVEATPHRLGHTYLRATYDLLHLDGTVGRNKYYTTAVITDAIRRDMKWWLRILETGTGRPVRSHRSGTLVPTWGDGSGTGTGGTIDLPNHPFATWMGQWSPTVFKFSSNWKELKTLLLTLQQVSTTDRESVRGATLFYFTDNSTTYWITKGGSSPSPGLHSLLEDILLLAVDLECHLQVVHVPGVVMINQGTDGLSRGIWFSPLHHPTDQRSLTRAVFDPLPPDMELAHRYVSERGLPGPPMLHHWECHWGPALFDHLSVWFPPPELARAVLIGILEAWVERPLTTSALVFVPRTVMDQWSGLSRHIRELDTIFPHKTPLRFPPRLPIPIIVLYLAPHSRVLPPTPRLDTSPKPTGFRWHDREAERMRRLPASDRPHG